MAKLKVIRTSKGPFYTNITVEAKKDATAVFDSFFGERIFFLDKGDQLRIRVKGWDWQRGDTLSMSALVGVALSWSNIPWDWYYD